MTMNHQGVRLQTRESLDTVPVPSTFYQAIKIAVELVQVTVYNYKYNVVSKMQECQLWRSIFLMRFRISVIMLPFEPFSSVFPTSLTACASRQGPRFHFSLSPFSCYSYRPAASSLKQELRKAGVAHLSSTLSRKRKDERPATEV